MINCRLCGRETPEEYQEKHHLVPKCKKGKEKEVVCCDCGDQLHNLFDNKELEREYNTIEKLLENERVQKWIKWIRKQSRFGICMKSKKRRK